MHYSLRMHVLQAQQEAFHNLFSFLRAKDMFALNRMMHLPVFCCKVAHPKVAPKSYKSSYLTHKHTAISLYFAG